MAKPAGRLLVEGGMVRAYPKLVKALKESTSDVQSYLDQAGDDEHPVHKAMRQRLDRHVALLVELDEIKGE